MTINNNDDAQQLGPKKGENKSACQHRGGVVRAVQGHLCSYAAVVEEGD